MSANQIAMPSVEGLTHRTVELAGLRMHVAEGGSGPPVLLLHGWPQHWYVWRKVAPQLAADYRVICPDLRGFGWSDAPPGAYDKAGLARDIVALLDALELERVELIGHDWGGWIGFLLCLEHPQRFAHYLALNIITPWPEPVSPRGLTQLARLWYQVTIATPTLGRTLIERGDFVRRLITTGAVNDPWTPAELDVFVDALHSPERANASVHLYRTFLLRELIPLLRGAFEDKRLSVPTLLVHGKRDLALDYRTLGRWRSHADDMRVELREDSGHFIAEEIPDVVVARARELFASAPQTSGTTSA
jgi:pimeloyl-ACP methyl ester carboxylesterase